MGHCQNVSCFQIFGPELIQHGFTTDKAKRTWQHIILARLPVGSSLTIKVLTRFRENISQL